MGFFQPELYVFLTVLTEKFLESINENVLERSFA